jgi:hypothetical protein
MLSSFDSRNVVRYAPFLFIAQFFPFSEIKYENSNNNKIPETIFNKFILVALLKFLAFSLFEMKYVLNIWKARAGAQADQRQLGILYFRFCKKKIKLRFPMIPKIDSVLMVGFMIIYAIGSYFPIFVFVLYSYWLPQIICNTLRGTAEAFQK